MADSNVQKAAEQLPSNAELMDQISENFAGATLSDPYPLFAERRRDSPIFEGDIMEEFGAPSMAAGFDNSRPVYTLFRYDDVLATLKDSETFSSKPMLDALGPMLGRVITGLDGDEHRQMRGMLSPAFSRENFDHWADTIIKPVISGYVDELKDGGRQLDLTKFALKFPVRIIYEILGFPPEDAELYETFQSRALMILLGFGATDPNKAEQAQKNKMQALGAVQALYDDLLPIVQRRREEGSHGRDVIGYLLRAEEDGRRLDDDEIAKFGRMLLPAAAETTTRQWSNVMACLLSRPGVLEEVRQDRSLVSKAIDEAIRYEATAAIGARVTTREVELGGTVIPEGYGITLVRASGNRDETVYDDAETFDIHRKRGRPALSFGFGAHMCIGMNVAKLEMEHALNALLDGLPGLRADPDAPAPEITGITLRSARTLPVVWG